MVHRLSGTVEWHCREAILSRAPGDASAHGRSVQSPDWHTTQPWQANELLLRRFKQKVTAAAAD